MQAARQIYVYLTGLTMCGMDRLGNNGWGRGSRVRAPEPGDVTAEQSDCYCLIEAGLHCAVTMTQRGVPSTQCPIGSNITGYRSSTLRIGHRLSAAGGQSPAHPHVGPGSAPSLSTCGRLTNGNAWRTGWALVLQPIRDRALCQWLRGASSIVAAAPLPLNED